MKINIFIQYIFIVGCFIGGAISLNAAFFNPNAYPDRLASLAFIFAFISIMMTSANKIETLKAEAKLDKKLEAIQVKLDRINSSIENNNTHERVIEAINNINTPRPEQEQAFSCSLLTINLQSNKDPR